MIRALTRSPMETASSGLLIFFKKLIRDTWMNPSRPGSISTKAPFLMRLTTRPVTVLAGLSTCRYAPTAPAVRSLTLRVSRLFSQSMDFTTASILSPFRKAPVSAYLPHESSDFGTSASIPADIDKDAEIPHARIRSR